MTPHESLRGLLEGLGVQRARVPASQDARTALFRTLTDGRRLLVLLDNARDAEHVRPLIAGSATSLTVVTSETSSLVSSPWKALNRYRSTCCRPTRRENFS